MLPELAVRMRQHDVKGDFGPGAVDGRWSGVGAPGGCASKFRINDSVTPNTASDSRSSSPQTNM